MGISGHTTGSGANNARICAKDAPLTKRKRGNRAETEYGMKKKLPIDITKVPPEDMMKYEMAKELGLYDQVIEKGWGSLSARQTGKIGGMIAGEKRKKLNAGAKEAAFGEAEGLASGD